MTITATLTTTPPATAFDIHVTTQVYENYNTSGEGAPYWKAKGGTTYVLTGFAHPLCDGLGAAAQAVVDAQRAAFTADNGDIREWVIDWALVPVGTLTDDEKLALEYDGRIDWPSPRIAV